MENISPSYLNVFKSEFGITIVYGCDDSEESGTHETQSLPLQSLAVKPADLDHLIVALQDMRGA